MSRIDGFVVGLVEKASAHRRIAGRLKKAGHQYADAGYRQEAEEEWASAEAHMKDALAIEAELAR